MNATVEDLRPTIVPKSDQLNAEQLLGGPMTVTVTNVQLGSGEEQPVVVHYENEGGRPFKPCKTMRKVLIHAWGPDGRKWAGRSMTLYNDPAVKFGGEDVGGIRISHMTHIERDVKVSLTSTRGKKAKYEIKRLAAPPAAAAPGAEVLADCKTVDDLKATFGTAWKATRDPAARNELKAVYDRRLLELTPFDAKTLADYTADIDNATSKEAAALVLDEARDVLTADEHKKLVEAFEMAWKD